MRISELLTGVLVVGAVACGEVKASEDPDAMPDDVGAVDAGLDAMLAPGPQGLYVGRPSPLVAAHQTAGIHYSPRLSSDGQRLYFVVSDGGKPFVAFRRPDGSFGDAVAVDGDGWAAFRFAALALSDDEKEIIVQAHPSGKGYDLWTATRSDRAGKFGALTRLDAVSDDKAADYHPFLRGNELFFTSQRDGGDDHLYRAVRPGSGQPFGAAMPLTVNGALIAGETPFLAADGKTLYFGRYPTQDTSVIAWVTRDQPDTTAFVGLSELSALTIAGVQTSEPFLDETRGEIVFGTTRAWSPGTRAMWRAQLCKGQPCVEPSIPCENGVRSADQRHCYTASTGKATWAAAKKACEDQGGHLVTLHSPAEWDVVVKLIPNAPVATDPAMQLPSRGWIGASDGSPDCTVASCATPFRWVTGEPMLYGGVTQRDLWLDATQPDDAGGSTTSPGEDCLELYKAKPADALKLNDGVCTSIVAPYVCESEIG